jgi:hypothetical protein
MYCTVHTVLYIELGTIVDTRYVEKQIFKLTIFLRVKYISSTVLSHNKSDFSGLLVLSEFRWRSPHEVHDCAARWRNTELGAGGSDKMDGPK